MHCHYFLFLAFILITIKKTLAQESNIFGDPNTPFDVSLTQNVADGGVFDVPVNGIYDNLDGTDSASTNSIFDTASDNSFDLLLGDNPDGCTSLQTFGRIRARGNDFCNSNDPAFRPPMVDFKDYLNPIPKDLTTQKELDDLFCPTEVFAGYLNVPCCNIFRELETTPVDTTSLDLPLYVTQHGLFNIEHAFLRKLNLDILLTVLALP